MLLQKVKNQPKANRIMNYTYIVKCNDGTLYTGWTNDLTKRMEAHNSGTGAKYTKSRLPVRLVYYEEYMTKKEAMSREYSIKRLSRQEKLTLIADFTDKSQLQTPSQSVLSADKRS